MITPEIVGTWYFRLNGFLTIPNFIVHPDQAGPQITDVDVLAVRFPNRQELIRNPVEDQFPQGEDSRSLFLALVEVKSGLCQVNRVLQDPDRDGLRRTLMASGVLDERYVGNCCASIWETGFYTQEGLVISHVCIGREPDPDLSEALPEVPQITWQMAIGFIYDRFAQYRGPKADHSQWDDYGRFLWVAAARIRDKDQFIDLVVKNMAISTSI